MFLSIRLVAFSFTPIGHSVLIDFTVPDVSPLHVQAESRWTPHTIPLRWNHIPLHLLNGLLAGYRIRYQAVEIGQCPYREDPREVVIPAENVSTILTGLESFAVYRIEITGLTIKGDGPSEVVFAGKQCYIKLCSSREPSNC